MSERIYNILQDFYDDDLCKSCISSSIVNELPIKDKLKTCNDGIIIKHVIDLNKYRDNLEKAGHTKCIKKSNKYPYTLTYCKQNPCIFKQ